VCVSKERILVDDFERVPLIRGGNRLAFSSFSRREQFETCPRLQMKKNIHISDSRGSSVFSLSLARISFC
jgi:hypothetical protein